MGHDSWQVLEVRNESPHHGSLAFYRPDRAAAFVSGHVSPHEVAAVDFNVLCDDGFRIEFSYDSSVEPKVIEVSSAACTAAPSRVVNVVIELPEFFLAYV